MATAYLIAVNGLQDSHQDPTPAWSLVDRHDDLLDQVEYREGDTPEDAVARLQQAGALPQGGVDIVRRERLHDTWAHEDHPHRYTVEITEYPTYAYRVEAFYSESGAWDVVRDDARGVEEYDGTAEDFAREVLGNHVDDLHTLEDAYPGPYRVLVWEGRSEGLLEDAAVAEAEQIGKPNRGGRPSTGRTITVRLPEAHIDALDALAVERGTTRPALIRKAVARLLEADPDPAEERWEIQVRRLGQWQTWASGRLSQMAPEAAAARLGAIHLLRGRQRARRYYYDCDEAGRPVWRLLAPDINRVWEGEGFRRRVAEVLLGEVESQVHLLREELDS